MEEILSQADPAKPEPATPIGLGFKIPVQYWYPTILAVISFTTAGVWWFHNQIEPLESRIAKLEASRPGSAREVPSIPLLHFKHLNGLLPRSPSEKPFRVVTLRT